MEEETEIIWTPDKDVMMATCLKAERNLPYNITANITAEDCINGK
jgi:hypothetical protein